MPGDTGGVDVLFEGAVVVVVASVIFVGPVGGMVVLLPVSTVVAFVSCLFVPGTGVCGRTPGVLVCRGSLLCLPDDVFRLRKVTRVMKVKTSAAIPLIHRRFCFFLFGCIGSTLCWLLISTVGFSRRRNGVLGVSDGTPVSSCAIGDGSLRLEWSAHGGSASPPAAGSRSFAVAAAYSPPESCPVVVSMTSVSGTRWAKASPGEFDMTHLQMHSAPGKSEFV
jgi:hypothetical protein